MPLHIGAVEEAERCLKEVIGDLGDSESALRSLASIQKELGKDGELKESLARANRL